MTIKQAMVLAAGLGTRLRPITDSMPKPLVKIGGKALIDYALDTLADAGVERAAVNIHHFPDQMLAHLQRYDRLDIVVSDETSGLMNSGGGLKKGIGLLSPGPLLVMNADLFWVEPGRSAGDNIVRLTQAFDPARMDIAMLCVDLEKTTGHNGKIDFGMQPDGRLDRWKEGIGRPVVYAGAMALSTDLLADAPSEAFNLNLYFDAAISRQRLYGTMMAGHWITVGTPEAVGEAEERLATLPIVPA